MTRSTQANLYWLGAGLSTAVALGALYRRWKTIDLRGQNALITGGSRGLGLVLARELVAQGARVAIVARDEAELERAREDLRQRNGEVLTVPCDVTRRDQVEALVRTVVERFGSVELLINNAGLIEVGPLEVQTLEDFEAAMNLHFWAPLYTTLAVLPSMRERGQGRIVNIASIGGKISVPHLLPYSASKFALVGLSEGLRAELAKDGIRVTTVCPGLMRTGSPVNALFKGQNSAEYTWFTLSDSLPGGSIGAEQAARQILQAARRGDAEVILSLPAKVAASLHGLFPGLVADLLGQVNRLLPEPGGIGTSRATGKESENRITRSWLTGLTRQAAAANNE